MGGLGAAEGRAYGPVGGGMTGNKLLHQAKRQKKDEFYTQLVDIENELRHYRKLFADKVVYCNCDDPTVSNFYRYFSLNFKKLGLRKLVTTCYRNCQPDIFSPHDADRAVGVEYDGHRFLAVSGG